MSTDAPAATPVIRPFLTQTELSTGTGDDRITVKVERVVLATSIRGARAVAAAYCREELGLDALWRAPDARVHIDAYLGGY